MVTRYGALSLTLCTVLSLISLGCGGSSSSPKPVDYTGTWDITYNLIQDQCGLVTSGIPGLLDQHIITQSGLVVSLEGLGGLIDTTEGEVREDDSLFADSRSSGDLFGDGDQCTLSASTSYQDLVEDSAESLLSFTIDCVSGFSCETQGVGQAERQPSR